MRPWVFAIVLVLGLTGSASAFDPYFLAGECETAAVFDHTWHEFGHDLTSLYVGQKPISPFALWGDKWSEATPGFQTIAKGGLLMEILVSAIDAGFEDDEPGCATSMNTIGTMAYTARMRIAPNNAGDFSPFSRAGRDLMGVSSVNSSILLEALADYRMRDSAFSPDAVAFAPSVFKPAEVEPLVVSLPPAGILATAGIGDGIPVVALAPAAEDVAAALPADVAREERAPDDDAAADHAPRDPMGGDDAGDRLWWMP
jgi:hypothetical protein